MKCGENSIAPGMILDAECEKHTGVDEFDENYFKRQSQKAVSPFRRSVKARCKTQKQTLVPCERA